MAPTTGPCEASSIIATVLHADSEPNILGRTASHASIHLLDDSGRPVAAGIEGEIYCSGGSVALGYLNDDTGTNKSFRLANPFDHFRLCPTNHYILI
jgi:non-ribosomal peptide synthetase component F